MAVLAFAVVSCGEPPPQLPKLSANAVILAFGDSLTYGTGAKDNESYPAALSELIGREVVNAGVPGEVSAAGLKRLPIEIDRADPDLIILCHGGNDMLRKKDLGQAEANIRQMISLARGQGIPVLMLGVPKPGLFLSAADHYQRIADDLQVPMEAEIIPDLLGDNAFKSDAVHPNAKGYKKIAESIAALLKETGAI